MAMEVTARTGRLLPGVIMHLCASLGSFLAYVEMGEALSSASLAFGVPSPGLLSELTLCGIGGGLLLEEEGGCAGAT